MPSDTLALHHPQTSILIVEDNVHYAKVLRRLLEAVLGYTNITWVENTIEAHLLISQDPARFQVLFVDFNFPVGDTGGDFLEKLQSEGMIQDKVIFLITSEPNCHNVAQATKAGAMGVVAKPFDREQLVSQIERAKKVVFADSLEDFS